MQRTAEPTSFGARTAERGKGGGDFRGERLALADDQGARETFAAVVELQTMAVGKGRDLRHGFVKAVKLEITPREQVVEQTFFEGLGLGEAMPEQGAFGQGQLFDGGQGQSGKKNIQPGSGLLGERHKKIGKGFAQAALRRSQKPVSRPIPEPVRQAAEGRSGLFQQLGIETLTKSLKSLEELKQKIRILGKLALEFIFQTVTTMKFHARLVAEDVQARRPPQGLAMSKLIEEPVEMAPGEEPAGISGMFPLEGKHPLSGLGQQHPDNTGSEAFAEQDDVVMMQMHGDS